MNSIAFPKMFNSSSTLVVNDDYDATMQNLKLLLSCESGEMHSDPLYGVSVRHYTYDSNNSILRDIIKDEIYTKIKLFIPQIVVERSGIKLVSQDKRLYVQISGVNQIDFTTNMYDLILFQEDER